MRCYPSALRPTSFAIALKPITVNVVAHHLRGASKIMSQSHDSLPHRHVCCEAGNACVLIKGAEAFGVVQSGEVERRCGCNVGGASGVVVKVLCKDK